MNKIKIKFCLQPRPFKISNDPCKVGGGDAGGKGGVWLFSGNGGLNFSMHMKASSKATIQPSTS